jgi:hypothetical protein
MAQEQHVDALKAAREQLVKQRRDLVGSLAKPFERGGTEGWRGAIVEVQAAIDAIDKAVLDEKKLLGLKEESIESRGA